MRLRCHSPRALAALPLVLAALLTACGAPTTAEQVVPTPTPLPPAPVLERPTYRVQRGVIEDVLTINGRVTPVDLVQLPFRREGRVERINVQRGDQVAAGAVLAELQQDEALDELRQAENRVVQEQRALEDARTAQSKDIREAELRLENARKALDRVLPGGPDDPIRVAQKELDDARRAAEDAKVQASETKTEAEYQLEKVADALEDAQQAYSDAFWDWDWVERHGTDPDQPTIIDENGESVPNTLDDEARREFKEALEDADVALKDAERAVAQQERTIAKSHEDEIETVGLEDEKIREAERKLSDLVSGEGNQELIDRQSEVEQAQLALDEARQASLDDELTAVENAQADLEKARKAVQDGQIIAPQAGQVLAIAISEGDPVEAFDPVFEIADPSNLEVAAELSGEQMRQLAEGQPVEISLLARPDVQMPAVIRLMPAPYGSGGSGTVQERDRTTRFQVNDLKGQQLRAGDVARIRVVRERKEDALWLPPEAILSFEGNRFVIVRDNNRERRIPVRLGIQTEERVEILQDAGTTSASLKEDDLVVGR